MDLAPGASSGLPITGERTVPGVATENYWFRRHEVAYAAVAELCAGNRVLEAGCGEGYGAAQLLGAGVEQIIGLDYDDATVAHAHRTYPAVPMVQGNLVALPFRTDGFDVVVSLQTVEHLWDQHRFVRECVRVLRPGGRLVLSTPNRRTFPPGNPFHPGEVDAAELITLVEPHALIRDLLGVRHGPRIDAYETTHGSLVNAQLAVPPQEWTAALAAFVAQVKVEDFVLSPDELDDCLDLFLVADKP